MIKDRVEKNICDEIEIKGIEELKSLGEKYYDDNEYDKAIEYYKKAKDLDEKNIDVYINLGNCYANKNEYDKAMEYYKKAKELDKKNIDVYINLGNCYANKNKYDKAIEYYKKAKELDGKNIVVYINLGDCYANKNEDDKAIEYYKKAKKLDEKNIRAYINLGSCYFKKNECDKAIKYYKKARELDGKDVDIYINLGTCYANKKKYNEAMEYYKKAKELDEKNIAVYINLGSCYANKKEYDKAIQYYKKAKELDENEIRAYINLGNCYARKENHDKAIECYIKAKKIDPNNIKICWSLAISYTKKKKYDKALELFEELIKIDKKIRGKFGKTKHNLITNPYLSLVDKLDLSLEDKIAKYKDIIELYNEDLKRIMKDAYQENNKENDEGKNNIIELQALVMYLKRSLIYKDDAHIAHYTKVKSLKYLLKNVKRKDEEVYPKFRLNNADYMNDPEEGVIFIDLLKKIGGNQDAIEKLYNSNINKSDENERKILNKNSNVFLTSFSKVIDEQIPMWVNYSDKATGCCILYNSGDFDKKTNHNTLKFKEVFDNQEQMGECKKDTIIEVENQKTYCLYNVKYFDKKLVKKSADELDKLNKEDKLTIEITKKISKKISDILNRDLINEKFNEKRKMIIIGILEEVRFLFKDKSYEYEKEVRIVEVAYGNEVKFTGDNEGHIVPHAYIDMEKKLKPKEVILGPKLENKNEVANYIYYTDEEIIVSESNIKYR